MPDSEDTATVDQDVKNDHSPRKRIRHRKKQLYENILKQMEFYFSDANLAKDRYLGNLIKTDPYVPLEIFLKFNKIRAMTQDINDIAKAMKHSTLLELSEDRTKVKRKIPPQPYNADIRTIYVESIPVTASREWVERVFSDYGPIAYISLPKFKNSQTIKGYAFIEFKNPEDTQKCLNSFTKMGCKLPTCMPPEELSSVKMFSIEDPYGITDQENKQDFEHEKKQEEKQEHKQEERDVYEPPKKKKKKEKRPQKGLDLKLSHDSDSEKKLGTPTDETKSICTPTEDENKSIVSTPTEELKRLDEVKEEGMSQDETKQDSDTSPRKKKCNKRKNKSNNQLGKNEAPKGALFGLQVLSKLEWKSLRNKYLNLQRKYMKDLKSRLQSKRYSGIPAPAAPSVGVEPVLPSSGSQGAKEVAKLERIPGVFVKEELPEPCLDVRLTKRTIKTNIHALHVDVKEGQTEVIIRFDSANAAEEYCTHSTNKTRILSPSEEQEQYSRAETARAHRRPRGRCRVLAKQELAEGPALAPASPQPTHTHIRFDD